MENAKYLIEKESKFSKEQMQEIRKDFEQFSKLHFLQKKQ